MLLLVGCGGGATPAPAQGQVPNPIPGVSACADGTVASYMGTTCSQSPAVMQWTSYSCTSVPATICSALGPNGANIKMKMDPNGNHTILVVGQGLWNVSAGQSVDVVIHGTVYGAKTNNNWPHFGTLLGQTGDGTEDNKTTVSCGANCVALQGVSDIPCSNTSPVAYCVDQVTIDAYLSQTAKFLAASASQPYQFTIEIKLDGGISGTATLQSVGIHLS
jgi:hypothetical protein